MNGFVISEVYQDVREGGTFHKYWVQILVVAILANLALWLSASAQKPGNILRVYFLDIGQGDAILIDSPSHGRMLIDGGPNDRVLSELGKILPFGDRRIDVVMATHPDADHITGLVGVIKTYEVGSFIESGIESDNSVDDILGKEVDEKKIPRLVAKRGMRVDFGDGAYLSVLFPSTDVSKWETNDGSIVAKLAYGSRSFLLTGDSTKKAEYILLAIEKDLKSDVLKAGHHGSKTSTSLIYAQAISPEYAVISAGKDNRYGHPADEVIGILEQVKAKIVSTDAGTILFETDGEDLWIK